MADELWMSRRTGYRRKGTRFSELRDLFDAGITARAIQETLQFWFFTDDASTVAEKLKRLDFDIAGIKRDEDSKVEGFVRRTELDAGECAQYVRQIKPFDLIAESTPLIKVLEVLRDKLHIFVLVGNEVDGIITRADLQKPPVRILLFGLISLFEMHLNFQVNERYPDESWKDKLSKGRLQKAGAYSGDTILNSI